MSAPDKRRRGAAQPPGGFLVVDKPVGLSSMGAVAVVRRKAGGVRTGHAGTLDPLASGVLLVALGQATRLLGRFLPMDKRYRTSIDLSAFTSTDDLEGERIEPAAPPPPPSREAVAAALHAFLGVAEQAPPAFSAVKLSGRRAYALARSGAAPDVPPRPVEAHSLDLIAYEWPLAEVEIHCGKGFYVRSLARDLGRRLGTGGHCRSIRRTAVGPFTIEMARPLGEIPEPLTEAHLIAPHSALAMLSAHAPR